MNPKQQAITDFQRCSESALRSELWLHNLNPSPIINKQILINMLTEVYFGDNNI
jgi:hypothetical protein